MNNEKITQGRLLSNEAQNLTYTLTNPTNDVTIQCTKNYLTAWLARGFVLVSVSSEKFTGHEDEDSPIRNQ